jgi:hypothetical protein
MQNRMLDHNAPLTQIPLQNGQVPPNIPTTKRDINSMNLQDANRVLQVYGLPTDGTLANIRPKFILIARLHELDVSNTQWLE